MNNIGDSEESWGTPVRGMYTRLLVGSHSVLSMGKKSEDYSDELRRKFGGSQELLRNPLMTDLVEYPFDIQKRGEHVHSCVQFGVSEEVLGRICRGERRIESERDYWRILLPEGSRRAIG